MKVSNLSLLQYSWWPQLVKTIIVQNICTTFLRFPISCLIDIQTVPVCLVHTQHSYIGQLNKLTPGIAWKCLNTILTSQFYYLDICSMQEQPKKHFRGLRYSKFSGPCQQGFAPYSREHALRQIYTLETQVTDPGFKRPRGQSGTFLCRFKQIVSTAEMNVAHSL